MTAAAALCLLRDYDASIWLDGSNLRVKAPASLPPAVIAVVKDAKPQLVALLSSCPDAIDRLETYEERAAILEFDAHLTRDEAERVAWHEVFKRAGPLG